MKNTKVLKHIDDDHWIEYGFSSWDETVYSIRNRYTTTNGGFSPRSSSEMPIGDVAHLAASCIQNELFDVKQVLILRQLCTELLDLKAKS